jgi:hypothetical protein
MFFQFWYIICNDTNKPCKATSSAAYWFKIEALHSSLYKFYSETFPKDFHVEILLRTWQEFDTLETAKA